MPTHGVVMRIMTTWLGLSLGCVVGLTALTLKLRRASAMRSYALCMTVYDSSRL